MTVQDALAILGATGIVRGISDGALVADVANGQQQLIAAKPQLHAKQTVTVAQGLDGDLRIRPIAAMLELAKGTVLNEDPEIAGFARRWSTLRYLGIFARDATGRLSLDNAALQYIGPNQRRVLSEELGIGFGIIAAKVWCRSRHPALGPISVTDVDKAIYRQAVPNMSRRGRRQPDYLLSYPDPSNPSLTVFELLETKGTVSPSNARGQLSRAMTQLAGLTVGGQAMTGIATATVSHEDEISVLSVDPERPPVEWKLSEDALRHWRGSRGRKRADDSQIDIDEDELFASATNVSLASLAEYSGQYAAAKTWLPAVASRRSNREDADIHRETPNGEFIGVEFRIDGIEAGRSLRVFQGVERQVASKLRGRDGVAVVEAQRESSLKDDIAEVTEDRAIAYSSDGAMLELRVM